MTNQPSAPRRGASPASRASLSAALRLAPLWLVACSLACASDRRDDQLGQVAKEWSKTIRASQVIPIYPLSEDLQPGDCFVVQEPIEDEVRLFEGSGFLPLTHHAVRVGLDNAYQSFYRGGDYGVRDSAPYPAPLWRRPPEGIANRVEPATRPAPRVEVYLPSLFGWTGSRQPLLVFEPDPSRHRQATNWAAAPRAAFPSFTVEVDTSTGTDLALPVEAVPVGLSLLNTQRAVTTVTLSDAYSYGLDAAAVYSAAGDWIRREQGEALLAAYEPRRVWSPQDQTWVVDYNFLRIVTRVYLVGAVDVSITSSSATRGKGLVGNVGEALFGEAKSEQPTTRTAAGAKDAARTAATVSASLNERLTALNQTLDFGGRLEVRDYTGRSVSLRQTFDRPLVVGYLAVDIPIGSGGKLGSYYITTQVRLARPGKVHDSVAEWAEHDPYAHKDLQEWLNIEENKELITNENEEESSAKLLAYLRGQNWARRSLQWLPGFDKSYRRINPRILHEVVLRPPGISVPVFPENSGETTWRRADRTEWAEKLLGSEPAPARNPYQLRE